MDRPGDNYIVIQTKEQLFEKIDLLVNIKKLKIVYYYKSSLDYGRDSLPTVRNISSCFPDRLFYIVDCDLDDLASLEEVMGVTGFPCFQFYHKEYVIAQVGWGWKEIELIKKEIAECHKPKNYPLDKVYSVTSINNLKSDVYAISYTNDSLFKYLNWPSSADKVTELEDYECDFKVFCVFNFKEDSEHLVTTLNYAAMNLPRIMFVMVNVTFVPTFSLARYFRYLHTPYLLVKRRCGSQIYDSIYKLDQAETSVLVFAKHLLEDDLNENEFLDRFLDDSSDLDSSLQPRHTFR